MEAWRCSAEMSQLACCEVVEVGLVLLLLLLLR
jgi:hypothetical protein